MRGMKKNIFCILFFVLVWGQAKALSEVEISGELDLNASVWSLPTGERGNSAFGIPSFFVDLKAPLKEDNLLVVSFEGSEEKTSSTERFDVKVREAHLDVVSLFQGMHALRVGLIPQVWQQAQYETWSYRFLGKEAWAMTEKWKYLDYSDLGFSFMSELPEDLGEWAFTLANGEGAEKKEAGPHKEGSLFVRVTPWSPWAFSVNYVRGNYDLYGEEVGLKERIQALVTYQIQEEWQMGLEYLGTKDPADAIRDLKMVEGLDVTALSGDSVSGQGGSLYVVFSTGPKSEVLLRYDYLNPVVGEDGKELQTVIASLAYQVTDDIRAAMAVDHTRYGDNFAAGARDRSKVELAAQVLF